jgi:hypothetical protein
MDKLKKTPYIASLVLLGYMPFHIFLSQWLSTYTGGLEAWKIAKDIVLFLFVLFTICLVWVKGKGTKTFNTLVFATSAYALVHIIVWAANPDIYRRSAEVGLIYNMRVPLFAILGYGSVILLPKFVFSSVIKVIVLISTLVAGLGLLQYVLPSEILTHVGYGIERGARAAFYIDDNRSLPIRIMATLREPNALGAYLVLPATALTALLLRTKDSNRRYIFGGALGLHLAAIFLTQSRSAMLAFMVSGALIVWWQYRDWLVARLRRFWPVLAVFVLLMGFGAYASRNTAFFQSYIVHGDKNETADDLDSNDYHALFIKQGLEGIRDEPLGHGPGTAGLASIQNPKGSFLTENYYVQIGYELGIVGLMVFLAINIWLYVKLWLGRRNNPWIYVLLASFWGYVVTNMLLHTWSNEAVAAQWWILAGMAAALAYATRDNAKNS